MGKSQLSLEFNVFAEMEYDEEKSFLYQFLSFKIAEDDDLLTLATNVRRGQPAPNLLFAAVHYLMLKGKDHPLKEFYPSMASQPKPVTDSFEYFKDFCMLYEEQIVKLLKSKLVQTNEVRRCAYLYPIFCYIFRQVNKPLSLIELGTSAGLQLLWDQYSYSYGTEKIYGNQHSRVHMTSEIRGNHQPVLLSESPPVASRVGIDLHTNNLADAEDFLWLKALIWPEHADRLSMFEQSAKLFKKHKVDFLEGDAVALLPNVVSKLPKTSVVCIFHTHVANQLSEDVKGDLLKKVEAIGQTRDVFHIYNNMWDGKLHLDSIIRGTQNAQVVGQADSHGSWFEWHLK